MADASIADKFVTTGSFRTHYLEAGAGKPLILIHGGGAGADARGNWAGCISHFVEAGFHVIAYDIFGFGQSDCPDPANFVYSMEARADQLIALIEALSFDKVCVIGNSMGGATTLGVAMKRPDLLEKIVLMGSAGLSHNSAGPLSAIINYDFTVEGMERVVEALTHPGYAVDRKMVEYRHKLTLDPSIQEGYKATLAWIKQNHGLIYSDEELSGIKTETLVVNGKDDKVAPIEDGYKFLELLENSSGYFIPHCGHWAMIEHPKLFSEIAVQFLKRSA